MQKQVFTSQIISYPCPNKQLLGEGLYQTDKGKTKQNKTKEIKFKKDIYINNYNNYNCNKQKSKATDHKHWCSVRAV